MADNKLEVILVHTELGDWLAYVENTITGGMSSMWVREKTKEKAISKFKEEYGALPFGFEFVEEK